MQVTGTDPVDTSLSLGEPIIESNPDPAAVDEAPAWLLRGLALVAATMVIVAVWGRLIGPAGRGAYNPHPLAGVTFFLAGWAIYSRQRHNPVGRILLSTGFVIGAISVAASFAGARATNWLNEWLPALAYGLIPVALMLFPDGRLASRRWRSVLWVGLAIMILGLVALGWVSWVEPGILYDRPDQLPQTVAAGFTLAQVGSATSVAMIALAVVSLVIKRRRAPGDTREQIGALAVAALVIPFGVVLTVFDVPWADAVLDSAVPVAIGMAILKYHLFDIDLFLNRALVYGSLTLMLAALYAVLAAAGGSALGRGWESTVVATGVVTLAFQPLRVQVQRRVNRLLYGDRADPYQAVSRLTRVLEPATDPEALLQRLAETITEALGLPFAEIQVVATDGAIKATAIHGRRILDMEEFPLIHNGRPVGRLLVSHRTSKSGFTVRERQILQDLARQTAAAVAAMLLTDDLRASRTRLVRSREEERKRLRNELHDGVGPALAGAAMQIGAAKGVSSEEAEVVLDKLQAMLGACLDEIRQIVEGLRPGVLDALGPVGAIHHRAKTFVGGASAPKILVTCDSDLPALPAAVEVAAFRIVSEAMTNAVRHSEARTCEVVLRWDAGLVVEVEDDGRGMAEDYLAGIGLTSMRDRTEELGGSFEVRSGPSGTCIRATLPVG